MLYKFGVVARLDQPCQQISFNYIKSLIAICFSSCYSSLLFCEFLFHTSFSFFSYYFEFYSLILISHKFQNKIYRKIPEKLHDFSHLKLVKEGPGAGQGDPPVAGAGPTRGWRPGHGPPLPCGGPHQVSQPPSSSSLPKNHFATSQTRVLAALARIF